MMLDINVRQDERLGENVEKIISGMYHIVIMIHNYLASYIYNLHELYKKMNLLVNIISSLGHLVN